jgi:apolipoprotein N-acyltransferase
MRLKIDRRRAGRLGLSALAAVLMFLSAPTTDVWPLMWIGIVPQIYVALESTTPKRAFLYGWLTGTIANTGAFFWMRGFLEHFGHMSPLEALPIMMLLTSYQGLEFAFLSWGIYRVHRRVPLLPMAIVAPLVMVVIELLTPQIFPFYLAITQAWVPAVIQIADITGPLGVTFVLVAVNGALYDALMAGRAHRLNMGTLGGFPNPPAKDSAGASPAPSTRSARAAGATAPFDWRRALRPLVAVGALVAFVLIYGAVRIHQVDARRAAAPKAKIGLVQANVGILEKWDPNAFAHLVDMHQTLSIDLQRAGADLVVWPESSYSYVLSRELQQDFPRGDRREIRRGLDKPLLFGAITRAPGEPHTFKDRFPYNTAIMMDAAGRITGKYDKVFLMIFGEYIPFYENIPWFTDLFPEASNVNRGEDPAVFPFDYAGQTFKLGPLICYEDILPSFVRRVAALRPNLFVNITNDAWFGKTSEPYQHMALAVFRSVEHRIEMVRAVNTGVSAHIDAAGRVLRASATVDPLADPAPPPTTLMAEAALLDGGGLYRYVGDLFGYLCLAALIVLLWRARVAAPHPEAAPARGQRRKKKG